ncbi:MAG TPA: hypothetical protein PKZ72_01520, partial [Saprospiraceae bacterium]|nr:hypothetical protein [Saprospiraceae bacterium]
ILKPAIKKHRQKSKYFMLTKLVQKPKITFSDIIPVRSGNFFTYSYFTKTKKPANIDQQAI